MKPHVSLTSLFAAIMLFAVAVAMHEAARAADSLVSQGITPVADRLVVKPGKKPLGFKSRGGGSSTRRPIASTAMTALPAATIATPTASASSRRSVTTITG